ncbi:MAG: hypothetical protein GC159_23700 [Phycisphaera sp.]|nr:hypothetical protein [Phycisphaera sp.]
MGLYLLFLIEGLADQPHPIFSSETWFDARLRNDLPFTAFLFAAVLVAMFVGAAGARLFYGRVDHRFFPVRFVQSWRCMRSRLVYEVGLLVLLAYGVSTATTQWVLEMRPHGTLWPPERIIIVGVWTWGVIWLGDALATPIRPSWIAAAIFVILIAIVCAPEATGWLVE